MDKILTVLSSAEKELASDKENMWKVKGSVFLEKFNDLYEAGLNYPSSMVILGNELLMSFTKDEYQGHIYFSLSDRYPALLKKNIIKKFQQVLF